MDKQTHHRLREQFAAKRQDGMSYSQMKQELITLGLDASERRELLSDVDDDIISSQIQVREIRFIDFRMYGGIALMPLGVATTVYSFMSPEGIFGYVVVWTGAIVTGSAMYYTAKKDRLRKDTGENQFSKAWNAKRRHRLD